VGIATWLAAAALALAIGRTVLSRSPRSLRIEIPLVSLAACCYGLVATALGFGGWNEIDWRAALFAFLGALTILPLARIGAARRDLRGR
jgi:hypothetical protein